MKRLTGAEEHQLALAAQAGDQRAKDQLFRHQRAFVRSLSYKFHGPAHDELFAAGCEGWVHALRTWKPAKGGIRTWVLWWVNAYAGRAAFYFRYRHAMELPNELPANDDGETREADASDEGAGAEEMTDALWRREMLGHIDSLRDRRAALVLRERMKGRTLDDIAKAHRRELGSVRASREVVRTLERRGVQKASWRVAAR